MAERCKTDWIARLDWSANGVVLLRIHSSAWCQFPKMLGSASETVEFGSFKNGGDNGWVDGWAIVSWCRGVVVSCRFYSLSCSKKQSISINVIILR
jgi:hypothetical protein